MTVLAPATGTPTEETNRLAVRVFVGFFVFGLLLRLVTSFVGMPMAHPDEHQQYLEQAYRMLHGYGVTYWEQEEGMRHPFYPACLAGVVWLMERCDIADPETQNSLCHFLAALIVFAATTRFAWEIHLRGDTPASLLLMISTSLFPDVIFVHDRLLTENAMMAPLLLAIAWLPRRPFTAGLLLGVSFGIRFHAGFLIAGVVLLAWWGNRREKPLGLGGDFPKLLGGVLLSLLCMGLIDYAFYGAPFYSPIRYVQLNLIEGRANDFGVDPWYHYFVLTALWGWPFLALGLVVMLLGCVREWRIGLLVVLFFAVHCAVKHKEGRFLWPLIPFAMTLSCSAFGTVYRCLKSDGRLVWSLVASIALLIGAAIRVPQLPWNDPDVREVSLLLREAGRRADLQGVGVFRFAQVSAGNYFFLRRDVALRFCHVHTDPEVPLTDAIMEEELETLIPEAEWKCGAINYLIAKTDEVEWFSRYRPKPVTTVGSRTLFTFELIEPQPSSVR